MHACRSCWDYRCAPLCPDRVFLLLILEIKCTINAWSVPVSPAYRCVYVCVYVCDVFRAKSVNKRSMQICLWRNISFPGWQLSAEAQKKLSPDACSGCPERDLACFVLCTLPGHRRTSHPPLCASYFSPPAGMRVCNLALGSLSLMSCGLTSGWLASPP